jgi:lysozyme
MDFKNYDFLKRWEGIKLNAYKDGGGVWTIGYGHTKDVKPGDVISLEQAHAFLEEDLAWAKKAVSDGVRIPITQNQYDAFVSLCYNIGATGFKGSTTLRRFNAGDIKGAADAITWWNKDNGKVIPGLVNRRAAEKALFLTTDIDPVEALLREYTEKLKELLKNG